VKEFSNSVRVPKLPSAISRHGVQSDPPSERKEESDQQNQRLVQQKTQTNVPEGRYAGVVKGLEVETRYEDDDMIMMDQGDDNNYHIYPVGPRWVAGYTEVLAVSGAVMPTDPVGSLTPCKPS
jgi:hypothetical protein